MPELTYHNEADEVLTALTHGPTPAIQDWEIVESCTHDDRALAILRINGHDFELQITPLADGE